MTGSEYTRLAKELFENMPEGDEAYVRCIINRYYYGLLHIIIEKYTEHHLKGVSEINLKIDGWEDGKNQQSIHSTIKRLLKVDYSSTLGGKFKVAVSLREKADYILKDIFNFRESLKVEEKSFESFQEIFEFFQGFEDKINSTLKSAKSKPSDKPLANTSIADQLKAMKEKSKSS